MKTMKYSLIFMALLLLIVFSYLFSRSASENLDTMPTDIDATTKIEKEVNYEPLCLIYSEKPILKPRQNFEKLDSSLSFRPDYEGDYSNKSDTTIDYVSMDENLSFDLTKGSINGSFFFSIDLEEQRIFNISGGWVIDSELIGEHNSEIVEKITTELFPCLKNHLEIEDGWKYKLVKENYIEHFSVNKNIYLVLNYSVELI